MDQEHGDDNVPNSLPRGAAAVPPVSPEASELEPAAKAPRRVSRRIAFWIGAFTFAGTLAAALWFTFRSPNPELDAFWQPVVRSPGPVLVCFGRTSGIWLSEDLERQIEQHPDRVRVGPGDLIRYYDMVTSAGKIRAALSIMAALQRYAKAASLQWPSEVAPAEFRSRTIVFIGAFNNPWTMDLNRELRFIFELARDNEGKLNWVIRDQKSQGRRWVLTQTFPQPITKDYALITRVFDRNSGRVVISAAGMNQFGTQLAGEFLADPAFWRKLVSGAPRDWREKICKCCSKQKSWLTAQFVRTSLRAISGRTRWGGLEPALADAEAIESAAQLIGSRDRQVERLIGEDFRV